MPASQDVRAKLRLSAALALSYVPIQLPCLVEASPRDIRFPTGPSAARDGLIPCSVVGWELVWEGEGPSSASGRRAQDTLDMPQEGSLPRLPSTTRIDDRRSKRVTRNLIERVSV